MPGVYHFSLDTILLEIETLLKLGLNKIILFGIPDKKDPLGTDAFSKDGIISLTIYFKAPEETS